MDVAVHVAVVVYGGFVECNGYLNYDTVGKDGYSDDNWSGFNSN